MFARKRTKRLRDEQWNEMNSWKFAKKKGPPIREGLDASGVKNLEAVGDVCAKAPAIKVFTKNRIVGRDAT